MDVFISWSGPQSKQVAQILHRYLPHMINAIEPWLSSADIEAGARWGTDIASKLQQSKVGIICLTPENLEAIWIHFEAGALAKTIDNTFVCPYLVGVKPSDLKGPLTQFQAILADEMGTRRLVETLNKALGENSLKADHLAEAFGVWWPKVSEKLDALEKADAPAKKRSAEDMLEELLELVRRQARSTRAPLPPAMPRRIRDIIKLAELVFPAEEFQIEITSSAAGTTLEIRRKSGSNSARLSLGDSLNETELLRGLTLFRERQFAESVVPHDESTSEPAS